MFPLSRILAVIEKMVEDDIETNKTMSRYGAEHIMEHYNKKPVRLLTHCNTGALATAGYGTALGKRGKCMTIQTNNYFESWLTRG